MTLSLISSEASKALLASIARKLALSGRSSEQACAKVIEGNGISVEGIDRLVQGMPCFLHCHIRADVVHRTRIPSP